MRWPPAALPPHSSRRSDTRKRRRSRSCRQRRLVHRRHHLVTCDVIGPVAHTVPRSLCSVRLIGMDLGIDNNHRESSSGPRRVWFSQQIRGRDRPDTHPSHPRGHAREASGRDRASGGLHRPCEHLVPRRCDLAAAKARQAGNASSNARGCGRPDNAVEGSRVDPIVNGRRQGQQPAHGCPDMVSSYTQAASGLRG